MLMRLWKFFIHLWKRLSKREAASIASQGGKCHQCLEEMAREIEEMPQPLDMFHCSCGAIYIYSSYCKDPKDYAGYKWQRMGNRE